MKKKRLKNISTLIIVFFLFILLSIGHYFHDEINVINENILNEQAIFDYILDIDEILLDTCSNGKKFSNNDMINFSVQYILNNYEKYRLDIVNIDDNFYYEEDGTRYFQQGYIDIEILNDVINSFFGEQKIELNLHPYYNKSIKKIALISKSGDHIIYNKVELLDTTYNDNDIAITLKYILKNDNLYSEFKVKYYIFIDNGKYCVQYFNLYDII